MKSYRIFPPLIDLFKKKEVYSKSDNIIYNGELNDYAEKIELYVENSITAYSASNIFKKFLLGLGDLNNANFKPNKYQLFDELIDNITEDYKVHRGFAILVKYNPLGEKKEFHHINFTDVRIEKVDSEDTHTKYIVCKDWNNIEFVKKSERYPYFAFNDNKDVVMSQIKKSGGFDKYKGQIYFWHGSKQKYYYPKSFLHPVMNDADTEHRIQIHRNKYVRGGMLSKKIIITPPSMPQHLDVDNSLLSDIDLASKIKCIQQKTQKEEVMQKFVSPENNEGLLLLEMQYDGDNIDNLFKIIEINAEKQDGYYKENEERIKANIRAAYFNIHPMLIDSDNSVFGSSGEAIIQVKLFYEQNVKPERLKYERALSRCFGFDVKFKPLLEDINTAQTTEGEPNQQNQNGTTN